MPAASISKKIVPPSRAHNTTLAATSTPAVAHPTHRTDRDQFETVEAASCDVMRLNRAGPAIT